MAYGKEFWRRHSVTSRGNTHGSDRDAPENRPFNLSETIERVTHAFAAANRNGQRVLEAKACTYRATLEGGALHLQPYRTKGRDGETTTALFRTVAIRRDREAIFSNVDALLETSVLGNTAQTLLSSGCGLVEHFEALSRGVAVTWILPRPLPGNGPLTVEMQLAGMSYAGQTEHGHHFADGSGTARWRVGQVTFVDAASRRWPGALEQRGENLCVDVPEDVLAMAAYPLAIDPIVEPEFGVDLPIIAPADGTQQTPALAFNGNVYLAVWADSRNAPAPAFTLDIYGTRVSTSGAVLDPNGIVICAAPGLQEKPVVAANGSQFFVGWQDWRNVDDYDIYGTRVSDAGVVLDPAGIAICTATDDQLSPAIAASGRNYLVVWEDLRDFGTNLRDIYGARVSTNGLVLDPDGLAINTDPTTQQSPAVAAGAGDFFIVWMDERDHGPLSFLFNIYGTLVTGNGQVISPNGNEICPTPGGQFSPQLASLNGDFLVVWSDRRNAATTGEDIYGTRVTSSGVVLNTEGFPISTAADAQSVPAVAANASGYLVAWQDERNSGAASFVYDILGARVSASGTVLDANGFTISSAVNNQYSPAIAAAADHFLVAWEDERNTALLSYVFDIYGARVSNSGTVLDSRGLLVSTRLVNVEQHAPVVAFNGTNYLVAWEDLRNVGSNGTNIYGILLNRSGQPMVPASIPICAVSGDQTSPAVACNDSSFLVVWQDTRNTSTNGTDIFGARVNFAGAVLDTNSLAISAVLADQSAPAVAAQGSNFFVVWQDARNLNRTGMDIYGTWVSASGVVSHPTGLVVSRAPNDQKTPAIAGNGDNFLVVWSDLRNGASDIYGARVLHTGEVPEPGGIPISLPNYQSAPAVAALGSDYLVVWEDDRNFVTSGIDLYGARLNGDGRLLDDNGFAVSTALHDESSPAVAGDASGGIVVWTDRRKNPLATDLYGTRVDLNAAVFDTAGIPINTGFSNQVKAAVAGEGNGRFLVVSQGYRGSMITIVGNFVSPFSIRSLVKIGTQATITWFAQVGRSYRVQYRNELTSGSWLNLFGDVLATSNTATNVDTTAGQSPRRFYRVVDVSPP